MKRKVYYIAAGLLILAVTFTLVTASGRSGDNQSDSTNSGRFITTDKLINSLETSTRSNPKDSDSQLKLANAYLQKVRETADTSYYSKAATAVDKAEAIKPNNPEVFATRAAIAYGRHDFAAGLKAAQQAAILNPKRAIYHGLVGDGHLELGNYEETVAAYQIMVNLRPDLGSFNRIAHIREIYGDIPGAQTALRSAISASSSFPENVAFSQVELGKLQLRTSIDAAEATFKQALVTVPDYEPAFQGLARAAAARGNMEQALKFIKQASESLPIAAYATDTGNIHVALGQDKLAAQQYQLARLAYQKSSKDGIDTDQEMALFLADNTKDYKLALTKAQAAHTSRPNIYAADTLAWAHYKIGNIAEAKKYSAEALRLGEFDPSILYHSGMIALKNNEPEDAKRYLTKALEIHPYFSIVQVPEAKKELAKLST